MVGGFTDDLHRRLQPKAEYLGGAFEAAAWTVPLFSEEVIRGGPAFALALLLRHLDPILRKAAGLGGWQVISPARATGRVRVVDRLVAVQAEVALEHVERYPRGLDLEAGPLHPAEDLAV